MKNSIGTSVILTLFGESHGPYVGAVLDGLAPGIKIDENYIAERLRMRNPGGEISTPRHEEDRFEFISGVKNCFTTGTPLTVIIPNNNTVSSAYTPLIPRPGHADYTGHEKYHGFEDYAGGGHFSGRVTAAVVAAGAVCSLALKNIGIDVYSHISSVGNISDSSLAFDAGEAESLNSMTFPTVSAEAGEKMIAEILDAKEKGDSVGGTVECAVTGLEPGLGEPFFDSVESAISHAMFSIPGVKGVEFGGGFGLSRTRGSEANDPMEYVSGNLIHKTNNNGGILGGITNGMPVVFRCAVKPTPSISIEQNTVNLENKTNTLVSVKGRHDPCIAHRAREVINSLAAVVICDLIALRHGTDYLGKGGKNG